MIKVALVEEKSTDEVKDAGNLWVLWAQVVSLQGIPGRRSVGFAIMAYSLRGGRTCRENKSADISRGGNVYTHTQSEVPRMMFSPLPNALSTPNLSCLFSFGKAWIQIQ